MKKLTINQRVSIKTYDYCVDAKGNSQAILLPSYRFGKVVRVNPDGQSGYVLPDTIAISTPLSKRSQKMTEQLVFFHISELESIKS